MPWHRVLPASKDRVVKLSQSHTSPGQQQKLTVKMAGEKFLVCLFALKLLMCPCVLTSNCSPGWERAGKACYRLLETRMTWDEADEECRALGGGLAVPSSKTEQDAIWGIAKEHFGSGSEVWIGCRKKQGTWHCIEHDGQVVTFTGWDDGESNNNGSGEDEFCARMRFHDGSWWDGKCTNNYKAICETSPDTDVHSYCTMADDNGRILSRCLTGHAITELPLKGVIACGSACRDEPRCRSFNVRHGSHGTGKACQLNDKTRQEATHDFVEMANCYYFDL